MLQFYHLFPLTILIQFLSDISPQINVAICIKYI